jgi:hypothetical protein
MIGENYVKEFNCFQNKFPNMGLENAKLLLVSDVEILTAVHKEVLKNIIGHDTLSIQRKYESREITISRKCQVIFVSNKPPTEFPDLMLDAAIVDKLIILEYKSEDRIPPENQIANLKSFLPAVMSEVFNWVMYAPKELLHLHVRAVNYNKHLENKNLNKSLSGFPGFVKDVLVFKSGEFISMNDLVDEMVRYERETGDDSGGLSVNFTNGKKIIKKQRGQMFEMCCKDVFGENCYSGRFTKNVVQKNGNITRPYGMFNVGWKRDAPTDPKTPNWHYFKRKGITNVKKQTVITRYF